MSHSNRDLEVYYGIEEKKTMLDRVFSLKGCAVVVFVMLVLFVIVTVWTFTGGKTVRISKETTYLTEPLTADGKRVDYFKAIEQELCPSEISTEHNGYRHIFKHLGDLSKLSDTGLLNKRYEKLGLDPVADAPTLTYLRFDDFLTREYGSAPEQFTDLLAPFQKKIEKPSREEIRREIYGDLLGLDSDEGPSESLEAILADLERPVEGEATEQEDPETEGTAQNDISLEPLTEDDLFKILGDTDYRRRIVMSAHPLVARWVEENSPALDVVVEGVNRPVFIFPMLESRELAAFGGEDAIPLQALAMGLESRATYRVAQGDLDGAIDDILACYRLGRLIGKCAEPLAITYGRRCEEHAASVAINANPEVQATEQQLLRLLKGIDDLPPRATFENCMRFMRYEVLDTLYTFKDHPFGTNFTSDENGSRYYKLLRASCDWNHVFTKVNEAFDRDFENIDTEFHIGQYLTKKGRAEIFANTFLSGHHYFRDALYDSLDRAECADNLKRITLALLLYQKRNGKLPPTWTVNADKEKLHSWRTLILPYLGDEEAMKVYEQIRLDEPWNSAHNKKFHEVNLKVYQCAAARRFEDVLYQNGSTNYAVIYGTLLCFSDTGEARSLENVAGTEEMFLVVEKKQCSPWMSPTEDIEQSFAELGVNKVFSGIGSYHEGGALVGQKGGQVGYVSGYTDLTEQLRKIRGRR